MNNHYIPQFYLARWVDPNHGKINYYYYLKDRLLKSEAAKRSLGCLEDLYALKNVKEADKDLLETNHYKLLDDKAAKVVNKLIKNGLTALNEEDKLSWCYFILSLMTRNTAQIQKSTQDGLPILERLKENIPLNERKKHSNEIEYYDLNIANLTIAAISGYGEFEEQEFTIRFKETFLNLNWWIDDYSTLDLNLITSDRPVVMYPVTPQKDQNTPTTITELLIKKDFILSLPISPTICFFAYNGKKPNKRLSQVIRAQNFNLVTKAHSYIFTNNLVHDKFIRRHFKSSK